MAGVIWRNALRFSALLLEETPDDLRRPRALHTKPVKRGMARHPFSDSPEDIENRFKLMDEAGVEKQVLSPNHPPYLPDEAECVKETFAYIERLGLPKADTDKILRHNAQNLFGFDH